MGNRCSKRAASPAVTQTVAADAVPVVEGVVVVEQAPASAAVVATSSDRTQSVAAGATVAADVVPVVEGLVVVAQAPAATIVATSSAETQAVAAGATAPADATISHANAVDADGDITHTPGPVAIGAAAAPVSKADTDDVMTRPVYQAPGGFGECWHLTFGCHGATEQISLATALTTKARLCKDCVRRNGGVFL